MCDWKVDVVQKFIMVFHRVTGWKEHHHFLVSVLFQEREQHEKTLLWRNNYISLYMVKNIYVNWDILSKSQDRYILAQQAWWIIEPIHLVKRKQTNKNNNQNVSIAKGSDCCTLASAGKPLSNLGRLQITLQLSEWIMESLQAVLTFESVDESFFVLPIKAKSTWQYFHIYTCSLAAKSEEKRLFSKAISHKAICFSTLYKMKFENNLVDFWLWLFGIEGQRKELQRNRGRVHPGSLCLNFIVHECNLTCWLKACKN